MEGIYMGIKGHEVILGGLILVAGVVIIALILFV
jgi:hypothetical protein